jgi:hypothetical protein
VLEEAGILRRPTPREPPTEIGSKKPGHGRHGSAEELEALLERVREALGEAGYQKLKAAIRTLSYVTELLENREATLASLRRLLCRTRSCCRSQNVVAGGVHNKGSGLEISAGRARLFAEHFLGFLHQSAFAKLGLIPVCLANAIPESLGFVMYVCEWVYVLPVFHGV